MIFRNVYDISILLGLEDVTYPGDDPYSREEISSIAVGAAYNLSTLTLSAHAGTHIDAPNHFFDKGENAAGYPASFWIFKRPLIVDVTLMPSETLRCGEWTKAIKAETDIVLFRSGWSSMRSGKKYFLENPGIHPEIALYLRKKYPRIRAIGIDWISVSPYEDRALGREAHRAFLDPEGENNPICIIEDMDLSGTFKGLSEIYALPLRVQELDSAPCTVVGGYID